MLSVSVIILLTIAIAFYFTVSQKGMEKKTEIITALSIEERVPEKEEAFNHEREERGDVAPLWENRRLLR